MRYSRTSRSPRSRSACWRAPRSWGWWRSDWPPAFVFRKGWRSLPCDTPLRRLRPGHGRLLGRCAGGAGFVEAIRAKLLPLVDCLTPNLGEAAVLLGEAPARDEAEMARHGEALLRSALGPCSMKGGHLEGEAVDLLLTATENGPVRRAAPHVARIPTARAVPSPAPSPLMSPWAAARRGGAAAKAFVGAAIERGAALRLGSGPGPVIQTALRSKL